MSPTVALENDVFRIYATLLIGLVVTAGLVIGLLKWAFHRDVSHAWQSYRGWLLMIPLVLTCVFLGRLSTIAMFTVFGVIAFREFALATRLHRDPSIVRVVYAGIVALGLVTAITDPNENLPGWYGMFMAMPIFVISAILIVPIVRNQTKGQLQAIALATIGFLYIGWMFGHAAFLANAKHAYGYLFYLLVAVELNDIAAYTCGKLFGRRKLRSEISPNKTWGGALGALAVSMTLPWLLRFSFPHFGTLECVLTGLIVGVGGQLGDLSMSVVKRDLGVKDMGELIQGHGGILDRVDSLIYTAPLFLHMARYFHGLG